MRPSLGLSDLVQHVMSCKMIIFDRHFYLSFRMGGAKISYIFNSIFAFSLNQLDSSSGLTISEVRNAIRNASVRQNHL